jgi:hypothetical protein
MKKTKNPVAQNDKAVPEEEKTCSASDLANALAKVRLTPEELKAWRRDLKAARKILKPPIDKWQ